MLPMRTPAMPPKKMIYQFKVTLKETSPPVWRRIQVPSTYTFLDLHVAIQDAMGWFDCHLHEFRIKAKTGETLVFGIPSEIEDDPYFDDERTLPGWKHKISKYESIIPATFVYEYDFGDGWLHKIDFEEIKPAEAGVVYPRCIKGKRACPPEDCGGAWRYPDLLAILADPEHEEHMEMKVWVESQTGGPFDPEYFDPTKVVFNDPKERLKESME
jgi:hypothetical protein